MKYYISYNEEKRYYSKALSLHDNIVKTLAKIYGPTIRQLCSTQLSDSLQEIIPYINFEIMIIDYAEGEDWKFAMVTQEFAHHMLFWLPDDVSAIELKLRFS